VAGWGGIRVAGFSLKAEACYTDGCINVRNMLSIEEVK